MRRMYLLWSLLLVSFVVFAQAQETIQTHSEITKEKADSAYIDNDFATAIDMYETLLETQGESADIYYNLGSSYYKMDQIAKSILNYEKALLLQPGDEDIRFNLELAQSKTVDKITPVREMFFVTWIRLLTNAMNEKGWSQLAIFFFIFMLLGIILYFFSKKILLKKVGFILAICFFLLCVVSNIFASIQKNEMLKHENGIIMAPSVTVKSTPNEKGTDLFILHEGRKVMIKDNTMKEWKEIQLEDGNVGWIPSNVIEII